MLFSLQVRIMFEVQDLKYATLATVSRCGMVWFSEDVLSTDMIFNNFLARLRSIPLDEGEDEAQRRRKGKEDEGEEAASPMLQVRGRQRSAGRSHRSASERAGTFRAARWPFCPRRDWEPGSRGTVVLFAGGLCSSVDPGLLREVRVVSAVSYQLPRKESPLPKGRHVLENLKNSFDCLTFFCKLMKYCIFPFQW